MNNVQFQDQSQVRTIHKKSGLPEMVIKLGLAKDAKGAQIVLLIIAVVAVVIGGVVMFAGGGSEELPTQQPVIDIEA